MQIHSTIQTNDPSRYIRRLCKHFGHKVETQWDEHQGSIKFAMGRCDLQAKSNLLKVQCDADKEADLIVVADCIKAHFDRFAVKEGLALEWD